MTVYPSHIRTVLAFLIIFMPLGIAQGQGNDREKESPKTTVARTKNNTGNPPIGDLPKLSLPETISNLSKTVSEYYIPLFVNEIEKPLIPYVKVIAGICISIICLFSLMQLGTESEGKAADVAYQGIRFVICFIFIYWAPGLITNLYNLGYWLTTGTGEAASVAMDGQVSASSVSDEKQGGYLANVRERWRGDFNQNYKEFLRCGLYMKVGNDIQFSPPPGDAPIEEVIPFMQEPQDGNYIKHFFTRLNPKTWTPSELFSLLTCCRGIMEVGLLSTKIFIFFLIPALRITSPIFACLAVNKKLSGSITMTFVKGTLVGTLVLPIVVTVLELTAYMIGNMALSAFSGLDHTTYLVHTWDANQMKIIQNGDPTWVALMGGALMAVAGACIIISPFISYKLATGSVFEGASAAVNGWVGAGLSALVSTVTAAGGAAFGRQADSAQNLGQFQASNRLAVAARNASNAQTAGMLSGAKIQYTYNVNAANQRLVSEGQYNQREAAYGFHDSNRSPVTSAADSVADFGGRVVGIRNAAEKMRGNDKSNGLESGGGAAPTTTGVTKSVQDIQHSQNQGNFRATIDRNEKVTNAQGSYANAQKTAAGQFAAAGITYRGAMEANGISFHAQEKASQLRAIERVLVQAGEASGNAISRQLENGNKF